MANQPQKPSLSELMKTAQKMQDGMRQAQEELAKMEVKGKAGDDTIKVEIVMNGRHDILRVDVSEAAIKEGKEVLEDLIKAASNDAKNKVEKASKEKMQSLTKNLGLPSDFDFPETE